MQWLRRTIAIGLLMVPGIPAVAADPGLETRESRHGAPETVQRLAAAVRGAGWKVFAEIDHAAAAREVGLALRPRSVLLFGNPAAGTGAMQARPTLAIDLPMRVLVWEDDSGRVFVTRSTGRDLSERVFGRHDQPFPADAQRNFDGFVGTLVAKAVE